jgi:putative component of membrane protein insertase Oxa1/YidC/SpoIIIJ protein YidD
MRFFFLFLILPSSLLFAHTFSEGGGEPWGVEADLYEVKKPLKNISPQTSLQKIGSGSIRFFQNYISAIDGPRSTFYPTSSEYTRQMICKYGLLQGIALGCDRLMRENNEHWVYRTTIKHGVVRKLD